MRRYEPICFEVQDDPVTHRGYVRDDGLILDLDFDIVKNVVSLMSRWEGALIRLMGYAILIGSGYLTGRAIRCLWQLVSGT